jgi:hypothetical protein
MTNEHVPPNFLNRRGVEEVLATNARILAERSAQRVPSMVTDEKLPDFLEEMRKEGEARGYPISSDRVGDVLRRCGQGEELDRKIAERETKDAAERLNLLNVTNEHNALVIRATGLRRRILELHGPTSMGPYIACAECEGYDGGWMEFPCSTYTLARDWQE